VLTFQSVMDSTVSTRAVVESLYRYLPENGSELVVFDINQAANLRALFRPAVYSALNTLLPPAPRRYRTTVITNASSTTYDTVARTTPAGARGASDAAEHRVAAGYVFAVARRGAFSDERFSVRSRADGEEPLRHQYRYHFAARRTSTLSVGLDTLMRVTFFRSVYSGAY
jgi:hypothetical protein